MLAVGGLKVVLWLPYYSRNFFKHSWKDFDTWFRYIIVDVSIHVEFLVGNFQNFQKIKFSADFSFKMLLFFEKKRKLRIWKYNLICNVNINDVYGETKYQNLFNYA